MTRYHFESPKDHLNVGVEELIIVSDDGQEKYAPKLSRVGLKKAVSIIDVNRNIEVAKIEYSIFVNWIPFSKMKISVEGKEWGMLRPSYTPPRLTLTGEKEIEQIYERDGWRCLKDKNGYEVFRHAWNPNGNLFMSNKKVAIFEIGNISTKYSFIALAVALNLIPATSSSGV